MSKKLNGAEVLQLILDGKVKFGDKFKRIDRDCIYVYKESKCLYDENQIEVGSSRLLAGTFELLKEKSVSFNDFFTKKVSFIEAIKAYTNGRDIMCELEGSHIIYKNEFCEDNCVNILQDNYRSGISAEEILNGEWYID